jgi:small GTP-binding protein
MDKKEIINNSNEEIQMKFLLIGEQAVGKSSLINQYIEGKFEENLLCAAGLDLKKKYITINKTLIKLMIYDTAGHERFRTLSKNQISSTKGILIVYDVTEKESFDALNFWMKSFKENANKNAICLIIGNKIDLENKRVIGYDEGKKFAEKYGVKFIETSAKSAVGVNEAFYSVAKEIFDNEINVNDIIIEGNNKKRKNKDNEKKSCIC